MTPLLQGVRVLELSTVVMGPFACQILADLGAEVVKVEPIEGDVARSAGASPLPGMAAMFVNNNRNKRTISVDLKSAGGRQVVERLIARSDVLLHNMREAAVDRLGLGYEAVAAIRPDIIYCAATGFGRGGRYADRPAYDDVIQAAGGLAGLTLRLGEDPRFVPTIAADKIAALYAVYGVLAALIGRSRGVAVGRVEAPMFEAVAAFVLNEHLSGATFSEDGSGAGYHRLLGENRKPHRTQDGWLAILPYTEAHWRRFLSEIGREDLLDQIWFGDAKQRSRNIDELYRAVADAAPLRTTQDWLDTLQRLDIPGAPVGSLEDLLVDPHLNDIGFFDVGSNAPAEIRRAIRQPVIFDGVASASDRTAPRLGADTRDILMECGFDPGAVSDLIASHAVGVADVLPEGADAT